MKTNYLLFIKFCLLMIFSTSTLYAQDMCGPVGWATEGNGVTGGGNATPVVVSSYSALKDAVTDENVRVVHISGTITFPDGGRINIQDQENKTIFGLPGSKLISTDMSSGGSGIFYVKRMDNLIIQNVYFEGPGAYDNDGNDNLTVDDSRNVWVDHCEFHDGMDGNFDIKNKADLISVTWCTFSYEKPPRSGGSGGSSDHRYTNLIGSSDGATDDRGKLRVTFQYCHWGEGCRERMPRVRYGKVHVANCYYSSSVANQGIRAGREADIRAEGNYFISGYNKPIDLYNNDYTAVYANNNQGASNINHGSVFNPPYSLNIADPGSIVSPITSCAGQTLPSWGGCSSCSESGATKDCNGVTNGTAYLDDCSICVGGNTGKNPCTVDCNGDQNGSATLDACGVCSGGNTGIQACSGSIEGEDVCEITGVEESVNGGFRGDGYANFINENGSSGTWKIHSTTSQNVTLGFRYANGGTINRNMNVLVNGNQQTSLTFATTAGWTTWKSESVTVPLNTGINTIELVSTTVEGGPNLDLISFSSSTLSAAGCDDVPDCNGVPGGTAYLDDCSECVGGNTGKTACNPSVYDCNGVENGTAYLDNCNECVGGNTGKTACEVDCNSDSPVFGLVGFATQNGGTTGGEGGAEVIVTTGEQLQNAINDAEGPTVIYVKGVITPSNSGSLSKIDVKDVQDISIIGDLDSYGELNGIGIKVWRASNIIIQNLKIHHVLIGDKDAISIEGPSDHIWVDHCELYSEHESVDKDYYDGLLDLKRDVYDVTFSWNYLHDSWKASLSGSSESDTDNRNVTYHHNFYENINSRLPLFRSGTGHIFNNYYKDVASTGINSRMNACVKIEGNYFENVNNPYVSAYSDVVGYGDIEDDNILVNSPFEYASDTRELGPCTLNLPYQYQDYVNCPESIPALVSQYAGVGKLGNTPAYPPVVTIINPKTNTEFTDGDNVNITVDAFDTDGSITKVEFFNDNEKLGEDVSSPYYFNWKSIQEGTYTLRVVATNNEGVTVSDQVTLVVNASTAPTDCNGDVSGTAYLDNCGVCVAGNTGFEPCSESIQGEDACYIDGIQLESENANYEGDGYANTENIQNVAISWNFTASSNSTITVTARYANGGETDRSGAIYVNDVATGTTINMPTTTSWDTWQLVTFTIPVTAGTNELKFVANSTEGLANLDVLHFSEGVSNTGCTITNLFATENNVGIQAFPNPFSESIHLEASDNVQYKIINNNGAIMEEGSCTGNCVLGTQLSTGIYILEIQNSTEIERIKILKD